MTAYTADRYYNDLSHYHKDQTQAYRAGSKSSRRAELRSKKILAFSVAFAVILFAGILIGNAMSSRSVQASSVYTETTKYTSIKITAGDTLWDIAEEYMPSSYDTVSYVEEIKRINNLTSDTIHAGSYLIIPYTDLEEEL